MRLSFKEWLLSTPDGAGEIWDMRSNSDRNFGRSGAKSKNVASDIKPGQKTDFDPEELFLGKKHNKKACRKIDIDSRNILGGNP